MGVSSAATSQTQNKTSDKPPQVIHTQKITKLRKSGNVLGEFSNECLNHQIKKTSCEQRGETAEIQFTCEGKSALLHTVVCCWSTAKHKAPLQPAALPPCFLFLSVS